MSYGYNGNTRFRTMKSGHAPLPAVERVTFRKTEPQESPQMSTIEKVAAYGRAREAGTISAVDLAYFHKKWALETYPLEKNADAALAKWYGTPAGALALSAAVKYEHADMQEAARIGDGDIAVAKMEREEPADKDDAGSVRGGPKVRHAHPGKERRRNKATPTPTDGSSYHADSIRHEPNRQLNTTPIALGKYCDSMASEHAAQFGISKSEAYDRLLKSDRAFGIVWKAALTLPAE